jgi:uncharacterized membrane protein
VLWRDNAPPLDLGVRGVPYDINEEGAIAIQGNGLGNAFAAYLWKGGTLQRLRGTKTRPHVMVTALNDRGAVVGTVNRYDTFNDRAAIWRNGKLRMLAPPPGAERHPYRALGITSGGLIIGIGWSGLHPDPWWWNGGRVRALSEGVSGRGFATHVDNRGRVVGIVDGRGEDDPGGPTIKWRNVWSQPAKFLKTAGGVTALHHANGYLVGSARNRPFLSHLSNGRMTWLPAPPAPDGSTVDSTNANGVASGRSAYAPDGGITVVGDTYVTSETDGGRRAILWTCAQNYR